MAGHGDDGTLPSGEVEVRDARPGEGLAAATCKRRSWQAAYRGLLPDAFLDDLGLAPSPEAIEQGIAAGHPLTVAATADDVVGVAAVGPARDRSVAPRHGELFLLYVDPAHWGTGVGHRLHEVALARLRDLGFGHALLWVLAGNERAARFYEQHGWTADGATQTETVGAVELHEVRYRRVL